MILDRPHRRIQFGLRTLLATITLAALASWFGGEAHIVQQRTETRNFLEADLAVVESATQLRATNGEIYGPLGPGPPEPWFWRRWMGDEAVVEVLLPYETSQEKLARARAVFPEAYVHARLQPEQPAWGGGSF